MEIPLNNPLAPSVAIMALTACDGVIVLFLSNIWGCERGGLTRGGGAEGGRWGDTLSYVIEAEAAIRVAEQANR